MAANEMLERRVKELEACRAGDLSRCGADGELINLKDDVQRLRAENSTLQSMLHRMHFLQYLKLCYSSLWCESQTY